MKTLTALWIMLTLGGGGAPLSAAVPEQFLAWGSRGPEFPPVPAGYNRLPDPADTLPALPATPDDTRRGYCLFARDAFASMFSTSIPTVGDSTTELKATAPSGEYASLSLGVHALVPLSGVTVTVSILAPAAGPAIPADHVDVRVARAVRVIVDPKARTYRLQPFLLEKRDRFDAAAGETVQCWLTLLVPPDAAAGIYSGVVRVRPAGGQSSELPVHLEVLPFRLPPAPERLSLSFTPPATDKMLRAELLDLREHHLGPEETAGARIASRDRHYGEDDVALTRQDNIHLMSAVKDVGGGWRSPVTYEVENQIIDYWDPQKNWFVFWPHSAAIDDDFLKAIQTGIDLSHQQGWPRLRIYALDEAGAHGLLDEAVYYYGLIKRRLPEMQTYTTIGGGMAEGFDEIGKLSPVVSFLTTNRFTPDIAHALAARGLPFGVYNGAGSSAAGARFFFGFYGWKTAASEILNWSYHFGDAIFHGNGFRSDDEGFTYEAPDGPLPSIPWEAVREGADDLRYTELLWRMIGEAKASGRPDAGKAAGDAEAVLRRVLESIPMTYQALSYDDRTPPPSPALLSKWRRHMVAAILRLRPFTTAARSVPEAVRSPFDFLWKTPAVEAVTYGPELLPAVDFGVKAAPWQVQAWNGKGSGEADRAVTRGGRASMRVDIPAGESQQAATVLVWPSWGDGKLDIALHAGREYEMSAYIKLQGRNVPPELKISLPEGAAGTTRSGEDPADAEGWRRIWLRAGVTERAVPSYLAVWVQGPGTVWVSDLSLKEVVPPPIEVSVDQPDYDSSDRAATASVTIAAGVAPAQVRFTLARIGGSAAGVMTVPFESHPVIRSGGAGGNALQLTGSASLNNSQVTFDPSILAPGEYQFEVELLDTQGKGIASQSIMFRRDGG